jgi:hypothetical protein
LAFDSDLAVYLMSIVGQSICRAIISLM